MSAADKNEGFSLIEVLVALVVLSVGMLGIAALSIDSVKGGQAALMRTKAINLAADMADRIRANKLALSVDPGAYSVTVAGTGTDNGCTDGVDGAGVEVPATATCDPANMAEHDIFLWKAALANARTGLPSGVGSIERTGNAPIRLTISVQWAEKDISHRYDLRAQVLAP